MFCHRVVDLRLPSSAWVGFQLGLFYRVYSQNLRTEMQEAQEQQNVNIILSRCSGGGNQNNINTIFEIINKNIFNQLRQYGEFRKPTHIKMS